MRCSTTLSLTAALALFLLPQASAQATDTQTQAVANTGAVDGTGQTMAQLYQAALKEGGNLTVYAGGDEVTQGFYIKSAFEKQFPGLKLNIVVDLSKYHDARINEELARKAVKVDVATLQTLHDFDYWKQIGALLPYKPIGWDQVKASYKDAGGAFTGLFIFSFSAIYNSQLVSPAQVPHSYADFLKPEFKNRLILTYPNDDDAVLYIWDKIISEYGVGFIDRLLTQNPTFVRGSQTPSDAIAAGKYAASFGVFGSFAPDPSSNVRLALPTSDPFLTWAQTGAIFRDAPHPAASKLYMSWLLTPEFQQGNGPWSVRQDIPAPASVGPLSKYNTSPEDFLAFMRDRARVERVKSLIERFVGPVQGINPNKD